MKRTFINWLDDEYRIIKAGTNVDINIIYEERS